MPAVRAASGLFSAALVAVSLAACLLVVAAAVAAKVLGFDLGGATSP